MYERFHLTRSPESAGAPQIPTDLPPMQVGSPRQREVAEEIREEYVDGANFALMWWLGYTDDGETSARRALGLLMPRCEAEAIARSIKKFVSAGPGLDATMWLDWYKSRPYRSGKSAVGSLHQQITKSRTA